MTWQNGTTKLHQKTTIIEQVIYLQLLRLGFSAKKCKMGEMCDGRFKNR